MTLDLLAVLFGGAVAILPIFAEEILHVGPQGLGVLRAAPAVGAVLMSALLALRPPPRRAGRLFLSAVALFGVFMIAFALSRWFWLSLALLAVSGAADMLSVYFRSTLIQVLVPVGDAGAGLGGQPDLHRLVERDRRLRVGRGGQAARHRLRRWWWAASSPWSSRSITAWRVPALARLDRLEEQQPG